MPSSPRGKELGFTEELFDGYLYESDDDVIISALVSKAPNCGNLGLLCQNILATGKSIKVPTPSPKMLAILQKSGYSMTLETHSFQEANEEAIDIEIEIWTKHPEVSVADMEM